MSDAGTAVTVDTAQRLAEVRQRYLEALERGEESLIVELAPGCLGLDRPRALGSWELAPVNATAPPPIDVTVRCSEGLCVLAQIPVRIAARRVTLERVALAGARGTALGVSAERELTLRDVTVMGSVASPRDRAALALSAAGSAGTRAHLERVVVGRNQARDAALGLYAAAGAWLEDLRLVDLAVAGGRADALIAIDAVRRLRAQGCTFGTGAARVLLRLLLAATDAELSGCALSAGAGALLEISERQPAAGAPLRLTGHCAVTAPLGELPAGVVADDTVSVVDPTAVEGPLEAALDQAAERLIGVDGRLERLLG
ncbi:MAG TPA: hypothetical protein VNV42_02520 [Solirubrobacteraceae bacterium]|jgi:hypothetical protein|nr:hypothetical protein [Solirubrobacteraceae bacterium]